MNLPLSVHQKIIFENFRIPDIYYKIWSMDELTKLKISYALRRKLKSATTKKKISQKMRGRKLSEATKRKISVSMKQRALKKLLGML